jgi:aerobic carbon-monoxide dehydrogenase medium subunit
MLKQYITPINLFDTFCLMEQYNDRAHIIAGGTDLVLDFLSKKYPSVETLIDISSIPELKKITLKNGIVSIGSAVTLSDILDSDLLKVHATVLVDAVRQIAGPQIRNIATIGGNVVNASPAADTIPSLLVLDSRVSITGLSQKSRELSLSKFLIGNRSVDLQAGEIVTGFHFPIPDPAIRCCFRKVQPRRSMAIAILNMAILLMIDDNRVAEARIAMGAVAPTAVRVKTVEKELENLPISKVTNSKLYSGINLDIAPISDFRATRTYRLNVAQNLLQEEIVRLLDLQG